MNIEAYDAESLRKLVRLLEYENRLLKECQELADLMTKNYGKGTDIGKQVEHYRTLFYALPEKSDIKYYWETTDTRIALVYHHDEVNFNNEYYYIHAEPIQK